MAHGSQLTDHSSRCVVHSTRTRSQSIRCIVNGQIHESDGPCIDQSADLEMPGEAPRFLTDTTRCHAILSPCSSPPLTLSITPLALPVFFQIFQIFFYMHTRVCTNSPHVHPSTSLSAHEIPHKHTPAHSNAKNCECARALQCACVRIKPTKTSTRTYSHIREQRSTHTNAHTTRR